jgi:hypothetical protein
MIFYFSVGGAVGSYDSAATLSTLRAHRTNPKRMQEAGQQQLWLAQRQEQDEQDLEQLKTTYTQ